MLARLDNDPRARLPGLSTDLDPTLGGAGDYDSGAHAN